jgi:hypothetical protein
MQMVRASINQPSENRFDDAWRRGSNSSSLQEIRREFVNRGPNRLLRIFGKVLEDRTNQTRSDACDFCRLNEVTRDRWA